MPVPSTNDKVGLKSMAAAAEVPTPVLPFKLPPGSVVILGSAAMLGVGMLTKSDVVEELNPTELEVGVLKVAVPVDVSPKVCLDVVWCVDEVDECGCLLLLGQPYSHSHTGLL